MNKMMLAQEYAAIHQYFFEWMPRHTTLDMGRICSLHIKYVYGQLSKDELEKILDKTRKEV